MIYIAEVPRDARTMPNRVTLVTGGTGGIGRAVAVALARGGDRVLFIGRDQDRAAKVLSALRNEQPGADHSFIRADLSLLTETARASDEVMRRTDRLDAVVLCAGILSTIPEWTSEGLERSFVLNYLSRYLMVRRLLPLVTKSASGRLVLVANAGKYDDTLDFTDLQYRHGKPGLDVAGRSQFANDLLARELADRVRGTGVEVTCVYPGVVMTDVLRNARGLPRAARVLAPLVQRLIGLAPENAAQTPVFLAQDPGATGVSGNFYGPRRRERPVPARARKPERRLGLWDASEQLVRAFLLPEPSQAG